MAIVAPNQAAVDLITGPGRNPAEAAALIDWMERMSHNGADEVLAQARSALPDVLTAVRENGDRSSKSALTRSTCLLARQLLSSPEATQESDLAVDPRTLGGDPFIEAVMTTARFVLDLVVCLQNR